MEVNNGSGTFTGNLNYLDAVEVLKKQLRLSNHSNTNYIPQLRENAEGSRLYDHPLSTEFAKNVYNDIREKVLCEYPDGKVVRLLLWWTGKDILAGSIFLIIYR